MHYLSNKDYIIKSLYKMDMYFNIHLGQKNLKSWDKASFLAHYYIKKKEENKLS